MTAMNRNTIRVAWLWHIYFCIFGTSVHTSCIRCVDDEYFNSITSFGLEQSKDNCLKLGRHLTEISDFTELELIRKKYSKWFDVAQGYWINAMYLPKESSFYWMTSNVHIGNWIEENNLWLTGYPENPDEYTGLQLIYSAEGSLQFRPYMMNISQRYLCEKIFDQIDSH
ncbi:unnamed protein product [Orchesella dallaii]|uniref:C-type lectin domain-containing protein n=1 Tax=Orchesella dallaii TaxID=48710 RepID=A0ABP1QG97_9HEXA